MFHARIIFVAALAALVSACGVAPDDDPTGSSDDAINFADLRARSYAIDVSLEGERTCTTPSCAFRARVVLRNTFGAPLVERCSVLTAVEASPFGAAGTLETDPRARGSGVPGFADAGSLEIVLEEGVFASRSGPERRFGTCEPAANAKAIRANKVRFDHDRDATGAGDARAVTYRSLARFDVATGSITLAPKPKAQNPVYARVRARVEPCFQSSWSAPPTYIARDSSHVSDAMTIVHGISGASGANVVDHEGLEAFEKIRDEAWTKIGMEFAGKPDADRKTFSLMACITHHAADYDYDLLAAVQNGSMTFEDWANKFADGSPSLVLARGKTVCLGYASLMSALLRGGTRFDRSVTVGASISAGHAWIEIQTCIQGTPCGRYAFDPTWYDYVNEQTIYLP